jgi:hypothetical protein
MGYSGYSKSNNACSAESEGRYPLSILKKATAKILKISQKDAKAFLERFGSDREWHHSSKYYNCIDYYDLHLAIYNANEVLIDCPEDSLDNYFDISQRANIRLTKAFRNVSDKFLNDDWDGLIKEIHKTLNDFSWLYKKPMANTPSPLTSLEPMAEASK